ncbi:MAG: hypothetical protein ACOC0V_02050 [Oceanicaulis sp.]
MAEEPAKPASGTVRLVAAFLWGLGGVTLAYGLWRTFALGNPIGESAILFAVTAMGAGIGTAFYALSASKSKA